LKIINVEIEDNVELIAGVTLPRNPTAILLQNVAKIDSKDFQTPCTHHSPASQPCLQCQLHLQQNSHGEY